MDFTEMLFAATVRDLAVQLRHQESTSFRESLSKDVAIPIRNDQSDQWIKDHPVSGYIHQAFNLIKTTADHIRSLE